MQTCPQTDGTALELSRFQKVLLELEFPREILDRFDGADHIPEDIEPSRRNCRDALLGKLCTPLQLTSNADCDKDPEDTEERRPAHQQQQRYRTRDQRWQRHETLGAEAAHAHVQHRQLPANECSGIHFSSLCAQHPRGCGLQRQQPTHCDRDVRRNRCGHEPSAKLLHHHPECPLKQQQHQHLGCRSQVAIRDAIDDGLHEQR
mmetsp:Transcript_91349/g.254391  ORF Transcript_91349/g.254391 Transcript_91349/m.254391 type:complete len:204 (+) Transcript_91349:612-1223(+)